MLGLALREEFRGKRLKGTTVDFTNQSKNGALEIPSQEFLRITYPSFDLLKTIDAINPEQSRPGAGKTTLANCLACQLGGPPVVSTDLIRTCALSMGVSDPWLDHVSHHAWKLLGECTPANVLNGYRLHARAVMRTTQEVLRSLTASYRLVLVEGVHLTSESLYDLAELGHVIPVFLCCTDPDATYRRKARLRQPGKTSWSSSLEVIQLIQDYLISSLAEILA